MRPCATPEMVNPLGAQPARKRPAALFVDDEARVVNALRKVKDLMAGEMKAIEPIYQRYHGQGVEVLAINAGQDAATVAAFAGKIGASYPLLVDESAGIAKQYGVMGLPTTYFVDGRGVVRAKIVGEADAATFEKNLKIALGAQP